MAGRLAVAGWFKGVGQTRAYAGLMNYDATSSVPITYDDISSGYGVTWLTQPLATGATVAYLADEQVFAPVDSNYWYFNLFVPLTNFTQTAAIQMGNQPNLLRELYQLIPTLNTNSVPYVTGVNASAHSVQLSIPYSGPTLPIGTPVTRRRAGGTYQYQLLAYQLLPTAWTHYQTSFSFMRAGTERARLLLLLSYGGGTSGASGFEFWEGGLADRPQLYYTLDGSPSVFSQSPVSGPLKLTLDGNQQGTIHLGQRGTYYLDSPVIQRVITFQVAPPGVSLASGTATITCATVGATIRYTTDGTEPTAASTLYTGPVIVPSNPASKWKAFKANYTPSATTTWSVADADEDGLPDAWEMTHFGNLSQSAADDPDGDGFTNLQEYQTGMNPNTPDPNYGLAVSPAIQVFTPLK